MHEGRRVFLFDLAAATLKSAEESKAKPLGNLDIQFGDGELRAHRTLDDCLHIDSSNGDSWVIRPHPSHGIEINTLGASLIPFSGALVARPDLVAKMRKEIGLEKTEPEKPIPLIITCPSCGKRHIDEGEWATRNHHTHSCQYCGFTWRPAVVATVGVQFLPGFKNQ
jgi:rubredoxin